MQSWPRVLLPLCLLVAESLSFVAVPPPTNTLVVGHSRRAARKRVVTSSAEGIFSSTAMSTQEYFETYEGGDYKVFVERGMARFRSGRVAASIADFDRAISLQPRLAPYMWQRGLSLYYADRFEEGAKQFRKDVAVNPNDTEEAIWAFMCEARTEGLGFDAARQHLLKITSERRPYMRAAYSLFRGESKESDLAKQMETGAANNAGGLGAPYFYANLYLGLYAEAKGDQVHARKYISAAVRSSYGSSGDYMYDLARVHQIVRGWES